MNAIIGERIHLDWFSKKIIFSEMIILIIIHFHLTILLLNKEQYILHLIILTLILIYNNLFKIITLKIKISWKLKQLWLVQQEMIFKL